MTKIIDYQRLKVCQILIMNNSGYIVVYFLKGKVERRIYNLKIGIEKVDSHLSFRYMMFS